MTTQAKQKPAFVAYTVDGDGSNAFWTRIGGAWPHSNGEGYSIELTALPLNGRIVLLPPKPAAEEAPQDARNARGLK